jgi:hypothetical protein
MWLTMPPAVVAPGLNVVENELIVDTAGVCPPVDLECQLFTVDDTVDKSIWIELDSQFVVVTVPSLAELDVINARMILRGVIERVKNTAATTRELNGD